MIDQIKRALEKATPSPWTWKEKHSPITDRPWDGDQGAIIGADGTTICWFGDTEQYYPTAGDEPYETDREVMVKAPEWLKYLIGEVERLETALNEIRITVKPTYEETAIERRVIAERALGYLPKKQGQEDRDDD